MKERKKIGFVRYLLYLLLVTSVITSASLAKYTSHADTSVNGTLAAFVTDATINLQIPLSDMLYPGSTVDTSFTVTNFQGEQGSEVPLEYGIQVETTGNLPLRFSLRGEEIIEGEKAGGTLASPLDEKLCASGGKLPSMAVGGHVTHSYVLSVEWPETEADQDYSSEIDRVSVKITTTQAKS